MRNSTIFFSAVMTTSALIMIYGVVAAYQGIANTPTVATQVSAVSTVSTAEISPKIPTQTLELTTFTPAGAAQTAAQVLGHMDLPKAESSSFNGKSAYMLTFLNGDVVYVGLDGMILSIDMVPQVITIQVQPTKRVNHNNNDGSSGTSVSTSTSTNTSNDHNGNRDDDHEHGG